MLKAELFNKWRGVKAAGEQKYLQAALLIDEYMSTANQLEQVKQDLVDDKSVQYRTFKKSSYTIIGILLNCILDLNLYIETIPHTNTSFERGLLVKVKSNLISIYEAPLSGLATKIELLFTDLHSLLKLTPEQISDTKQAIKQLFNVFIALSVVSIFLKSLNSIHIATANALINMDWVNENVASLLEKIECMINELNKKITPQAEDLKSTQALFNERFLEKLHKEDKASLLVYLQETSVSIDSVVSLKRQKAQIKIAIEKISEFLEIYQENDGKFINRLFYLELKNIHIEAYQLLMRYADPQLKILLLDKESQLSMPNPYWAVYFKIMYKLFQFTTNPNVFFNDQYMLTPARNEFECNQEVQLLAEQTLADLKLRTANINGKLNAIAQQLALETEQLKQNILNDTPENLNTVNDANKALQHSLSLFIKISQSLENNSAWLRENYHHRCLLLQFIQVHDGFLFRLSNFLSQFCSIFKSDTALVIDEARALYAQLKDFEDSYIEQINQQLEQLDISVDLNKELKEALQEKMLLRTTSTLQMSQTDKTQIRFLISQLNDLLGNVELNKSRDIEQLPVSDILIKP